MRLLRFISNTSQPSTKNSGPTSNLMALIYFILIVVPFSALFVDFDQFIQLWGSNLVLPVFSAIPFHLIVIGIAISIYLGLNNSLKLPSKIGIIALYTFIALISGGVLKSITLGPLVFLYIFILIIDFISTFISLFPFYLILIFILSFIRRKLKYKHKNLALSTVSFGPILSSVIILLIVANIFTYKLLPSQKDAQHLYHKAVEILKYKHSMDSYEYRMVFLQLNALIDKSILQNPKDMHSFIVIDPNTNTLYRIDVIPIDDSLTKVTYIPLVQYIKEHKSFKGVQFYSESKKNYDINIVSLGYFQQPTIQVHIDTQKISKASKYIKFAYALKNIDMVSDNKIKIYVNLNTLENPYRQGATHYHILLTNAPHDLKVSEVLPIIGESWNNIVTSENLNTNILIKKMPLYNDYKYYYFKHTFKYGTFKEPLQLVLSYNGDSLTGKILPNPAIQNIEDSYKRLLDYLIPSTLLHISLFPSIVAGMGYIVIKRFRKKYK